MIPQQARLIVLFMAILSIFHATHSFAEEKEQLSRTVRPITEWDASASITLLPGSNLHATNLDAAMEDYRLKLARNLKINDQLTLSIGGGYGLKHIDAPVAAHLPADLHALTLELGGSYRISSKSFVSLKASPGLYSDFDGSGGNETRMPLLLLGGYSFDNGFSTVAGFMYRFGYHSNRFIPAFGFSYQPNAQWRFDAVAPRPAVTYTASRQLKFFVAGDFASDEYGINGKTYHADVIKYSDYKLSGGVTYLPVPPVRISMAAGYAFDRQFSFYDGIRADQHLGSAPFFRLSFDAGW